MTTFHPCLLAVALILLPSVAFAQASSDHCAGALCAEQGLCTPTSGSSCAAATDGDCERSAACSYRGECSAVAGACRATTTQACMRSLNCSYQQACSLDHLGQRCVPAPPIVRERWLEQPEDDADAGEPSGEYEWYGWQNLLAYAGAGGLFAAGVAADSAELATTAGMLYVHAGPIVHGAHGNWGRGGAAIAMNTAVPTTAMTIGAAAGGLGGFFGGAIAAGVGLGITTIIDITALAWEPAERTVPNDVGAIQWAVVPTGNGVAIAGTF